MYRPGQFTGEVSTLSGRRALFRSRADNTGEVIELDRQHMLVLVQTDAELSEILMRAFILRRVGLAAAGVGDVVLIGSTHSAGTLRLKEFLMRNGHPYSYIDLERDPDVQNLLDGFHVAASEIPVVICRGQVALRKPTNQQVGMRMKGIAVASGGTLLKTELSAKLQDAGVNATAYAAKLPGGHTSVIILNKDAAADLEVELDFGRDASGVVQTETLLAPGLDSREAHITTSMKTGSLKQGKCSVAVPHATGITCDAELSR